ncbi:ABC transporter substrate-binding protein [Pigmentiphaga sp. NML030171]|uniref:Bug family tripartite tricarboxylate transporter substrate binding protein n=1 Tax=Pigmentiphaga sp. NML030171 TaxID=2008676 RepID=UPI000B41E8B9|nr:tripartite tricarboxylate transporter substrate binding protein [Pigmentiphaga sp. NML030171]OVZ65065.1 ABC transporter substrate-binding protein [Pigmentiphaga sp. NML030171]
MKSPHRARRGALSRAMAGLAALLLTAPLAWAQDSRPIEWVVGMAPGGGTDTVARVLAEAMGRTLQQSIVVVNKPGAAHNIATDYVVRSKDYGHVMVTADYATLATNPFLYSKLTNDAERDLRPVGMLVRFPLILVVRADSPIKDFKGFMAWARTQQQGVSYGSPGPGTPHHLATELLRERTGLNLVHVPYRGAAPAIQDIMAGQIPFMFVESGSGIPYITGGKLRPLAVASARRIESLPDTPTLQEEGLKDFVAFAWQGLSVPTGTPQATIDRLNQALVGALQSAPVKARFEALGIEAMPTTPAEMASFSHAEKERWGKLIRQIGLKID